MEKQHKRLSVNKKISKPSSTKKLLAALIFVICAVVLVVHWPVLSAQAMSLDDDQYLTENSLIQNPGWDSARRFFTEVLQPSKSGYYQPTTMISLMVDYALRGRKDNLRQFHRTSLALHVINTALVILLLYLLFSQVPVVVGAGLLLGLHPINVEPIAWLSERATTLGSFFALLCLVIYVRYAAKKNWKLYVGCLVTYALALMSKPTTIPIPLLMLLLDCWPLRRAKHNDNDSVYGSIGRAIKEKLPFFALAGIFAFIIYVSRSRISASPLIMPTDRGVLSAPLIICHNIVFYLYKIVWPVKLSGLYPFPEPLGLSDPMILAGVLGTPVLIILLVISLRWTPGILIGWLIYFVALGPTIQIIGFSHAIAGDKYVYLPSIGLLMLLALLLHRLGKFPRIRFLTAVMVLLLAAGESVATRRHLAYWRDTVSLYEYMLTVSPNSSTAHNHLGSELERRGELDKAARHFREAIRIEPDYAKAHYNLGLVLNNQGKVNEAISCYNQALLFNPDFFEAHYDMAVIMSRGGRFDQAIVHYRRALQLKPDHSTVHNNLGSLLAARGEFDEAINHFRYVVQIKPEYDKAHYNLGLALKKTGRLDEAFKEFQEALRLNPEYPATLVCIAHILAKHPEAKKRDLNQAIRLADRACELFKSQDISMLDMLAAVYAQATQYDRAIAITQEMLDIAAARGANDLIEHLHKQLEHYKQKVTIQP